MVVLDLLLEQEWNAFLGTLTAAELHWISRAPYGEPTRELALHDLFVRGEISVEKIEEMISQDHASPS